jgi:hypothetical protein
MATHVAHNITAFDLIEELADLFLTRGIPEHLRSDNGSEFTAHVMRGWLNRLGVKTLSSGRAVRERVVSSNHSTENSGMNF